MVKIAIALGLGGAFAAPVATHPTQGNHGTAAGRCRVSTTSSHPVRGRSSFNFGNAHIAVALPAGARFVVLRDGSPRGGWAFLQHDGWIRTKLGWFSTHGQPRVTGRRVDGRGRRLRADVGPLSYASGGAFYPSLLYFPSFGCWRIAATTGAARLTAVVDVTR